MSDSSDESSDDDYVVDHCVIRIMMELLPA